MRPRVPIQSPLVLLLVLFPVLLLALGCQAKPTLDPGFAGVALEQAEPQPAAPPPARTAQLGRAVTAPDEAAPVAVPSERKLIRNGSLSLEVDTVPEAVARVKERVEAADGYVGNESESQDGFGRRSASLTCRVPAERLDEVVAGLRTLGKVESVSLGAQDVTEQYFDLEIRLTTQKELEGRLRDLLRRPSNELSDLLEIERELARVRTEIDQMEGRKRFWDQQIAMSTLTVSLAEPRPKVAAGEGGVWRTLASSVRRAGENFVLAVAGIISVTGGLVPVALALWLAWALFRALRRRGRRARSLAPPPTD